MNETDRVARALAQTDGIQSVTRGWPAQNAKLPCAALHLSERSAVDMRDNEVYLTKTVYLVRIFDRTMGGCDALKAAVTTAMGALGYTLERVQQSGGEEAQLKLTFEKLE